MRNKSTLRFVRGLIGRAIVFGFLSVLCGSGWAAVSVLPPNFTGAQQPQVCVDANTNVFITFGKGGSIYSVSSFDAGKTFDPPAKVASLNKLALGMRRGPRIVLTAHRKIISAIAPDTGALHVWSSATGSEWESCGVANDEPGAVREGLHAMASDGKARVFIAWLDLRHDKTEVWGALSRDEGKTWQKNVRIYQSPDGHVCECCHPSVVFTPQGGIVVMWRNWLEGSRDMFMASSQDGQKFSAGQKLGQGRWPLKGCPMDGGALTVGPAGSVVSIWRRDNAIFSASGMAEEKRLGQGSQPVLCAANQKLIFIWQDASDLMVRHDSESALSYLLAANGRYAAAASGGPEKPAVVVWESTETKTNTIMAEVIR